VYVYTYTYKQQPDAPSLRLQELYARIAACNDAYYTSGMCVCVCVYILFLNTPWVVYMCIYNSLTYTHAGDSVQSDVVYDALVAEARVLEEQMG
jgi:hypothetical protein